MSPRITTSANLVAAGMFAAFVATQAQACGTPYFAAHAPSPPTLAPHKPLCMGAISDAHTCDEWETDRYRDEVDDYVRSLEDYAQESESFADEAAQFAHDAQSYAECAAAEARAALD